ncbi:MAG: efflux RND transporter periplasmic adaptor subunit [Bradyrhizobium sp.]|uniref:efflux RND transporter periplasmic adaptor subunit n=1 Tax=Bradyrhizobium sp. TaxID=376 RepID=UPI002A326A05|nr:efflux RND transporter periplasmic adaptor subunit [Bradyrhizobium sp.]
MKMETKPAAPVAATEELPPEVSRFPRWKVLGALLLVVAAAAVAWWYMRGPAITLAKVTRGAAAEIVYATGSVEPETWSRLTPLVRGRLVERCRCEGKEVKAGERLARLDDREAQATLRDLRALESFALQESERQTQLFARGATTAQSQQKAESELARIKAQISAQVERLRYYELLAPMDGTVLREDGEVGDMVEPGTILYRIGLERPLWVVAEVNEEDLPRIKVGQKALLRTDAFAGRTLTGTVKQITPAGDPVAKTFRVRIGLPDDTPLHIGMSVEANVVTREKTDTLLVPSNAVIDDGLLAYKDGQLSFRKVQTGIKGTNRVEILSGAEEGELVASPATTNIRNRTRVRVTDMVE